MSNILHTLSNGLTYGGQSLHIIINYTLIILAIVPFLLNRDSHTNWKHQGWIISFVIIASFQVAVWFLMDAVGVSLIWCTMAGYLVVYYWLAGFGEDEAKIQLTLIALLSAFAAIVYYAIVFPVITTVAHVVAVLIGVGLFFIMRSISRNILTRKTR